VNSEEPQLPPIFDEIETTLIVDADDAEPDLDEIIVEQRADAPDIEALVNRGWRLVAPAAVAADPEAYRRYLTSAKAELLIPKQMYVATRGGLLSDRSIYFLASGRPVLARDTGLAGVHSQLRLDIHEMDHRF
jgi:hypothetical protein